MPSADIFKRHAFSVLLALAAVGILWSAYLYWPSENAPKAVQESAKSYKKTKPSERGTEEAPLVVRVLPATDDKSKADTERAEKHEKAVYDHLLVSATVALAVFTLALACFTAYLWSSTSELVSDAKKNSVRELRAYVAIDSAAMTSFNDGAIPEAIIWIKNYGATPAYELTGEGGIALGVSFDKLVPPTIVPGRTKATLSPGGKTKHFASFNKELKTGTMDALRAGQLTLFVYGEFRFFDAFDIERFVKYRFQTGGNTGVRGNDLAICEDGNEET